MMSTELQPKPLPTLQELHHDIEAAVMNDALNTLLNQPPVTSWIKENPFANNTKYLPIDKVELLLTRIFQEYEIHVKEVKQLFNAISVTVTLKVRNPLTGEWKQYDGVGACQVQTKSGASPAELDKINNNAVQMALPAAKSYAVKDAAEHLGKLFGRDLKRKDVVGFETSYAKKEDLKEAIKKGKAAKADMP